MVDILVVCGIKGFNKFHETIINVINNNTPILVSKESCKFYTLQTINNYFNEDAPADLYISNISSNLFIFDRSFEDAVFDGDQDESYLPIKKFNIEHNNKFDYIVLEHCPTFLESIMIPEFVKHYNMLKPNGYFIIFINQNLGKDFKFYENSNFLILDNIFTRINNNVYQKMNNNIYNMEANCKNFMEYCTNYIPPPIYEVSSKQKYLKYKKKYLELTHKSI